MDILRLIDDEKPFFATRWDGSYDNAVEILAWVEGVYPYPEGEVPSSSASVAIFTGPKDGVYSPKQARLDLRLPIHASLLKGDCLVLRGAKSFAVMSSDEIAPYLTRPIIKES